MTEQLLLLTMLVPGVAGYVKATSTVDTLVSQCPVPDLIEPAR